MMNPYVIAYRLAGLFVLVATIVGVSLFLWNVMGVDVSTKVNRIGMMLELLGVLSVMPEVIGEDTAKGMDEKFKSLSVQLKSLFKDVSRLVKEVLPDASRSYFPSGIIGRLILAGNTIGSILYVVGLYYDKALANNLYENARFMYYWFYISATIGLFLGYVILITSKISKGKEPTVPLGLLFIVTYLPMTLFSLPFTMALSIVLWSALALSLFLLRFQFRQIIAWITLPLILIGNLLQFVSTFF